MGSLLYVVGPSGAGKDSVIGYARERIAPDWPVLFAHRYITRPVGAGGENHVALSRGEFRQRRDLGLFSLHWESHGHAYGLGLEIEAWLERGLVVIMNGSREYLDTAALRLPALVPVVIEVDPAVLRQRLEARGRETTEAIERRLARADRYRVAHAAAVAIDNSGSLEDAGQRLLALIRLKVTELQQEATTAAQDSTRYARTPPVPRP